MRSRTFLVFWIVVALQVVAVLGFVGVREFTLRTGREVVLRTVPVDPRDLFRGDYVVLRYEISTLPRCYFYVGNTVYVFLAQKGDTWEATGNNSAPPIGDGQPFIRGRVTGKAATGACVVEYGIESYFVREGTGREIEQARGKAKVRVAVDGFGTAVIKEVIVEKQ